MKLHVTYRQEASYYLTNLQHCSELVMPCLRRLSQAELTDMMAYLPHNTNVEGGQIQITDLIDN